MRSEQYIGLGGSHEVKKNVFILSVPQFLADIWV